MDGWRICQFIFLFNTKELIPVASADESSLCYMYVRACVCVCVCGDACVIIKGGREQLRQVHKHSFKACVCVL